MAPPGTVYGGRFVVTMIPGDGIGREVCAAVKTVFSAANVPIDWEEVRVSDSDDLSLALDSLRRNKIGLKGVFYTPLEGRLTSMNMALRRELNIYANVALVRSFASSHRHQGVDFVVIRENMEGEYSGLEHQPLPGVVESLKIVSRERSEQVIKFAFDYAIKHGRRKITCVHKANIMKLTDGLFLGVFHRMAERYRSSGIVVNDMIVDNTSMQLVSKPHQFDVIVTPNLYGTIVTNIGAGLVGSPGLIPGYNIGTDHVLFEPGARHVGRDIEGMNCANPVSMILSGCMMLKHLGLSGHAQLIQDAVIRAISSGKALTSDMGGKASTTDFSQSVIDHMHQ